MSTKHMKLNRPTNVDLVRNPLIGGSKGTTMAGVGPNELEEFEGTNTFEGDIENDTIDCAADAQRPHHGYPRRRRVETARV